jgi:hypothetical protein
LVETTTKGGAKMASTKKEEALTITPPNLQRGDFKIIGVAPYVQLKFSQKSMMEMKAKHEKGSQAKKGQKRKARDFNEDYENSSYRTTDGKYGIPASSFRNAMISACKIIGFHMTKAKLSVFALADDIDRDDGTPLIYIKPKPEMHIGHVRNATGVADLRVRSMWREWSAVVKLQWDADMFSNKDVANLLARVGMQVGIGEGRPDSKSSCGMGWGLFKLEEA